MGLLLCFSFSVWITLSLGVHRFLAICLPFSDTIRHLSHMQVRLWLVALISFSAILYGVLLLPHVSTIIS
jgi:hypothetical protein